MQENKKLHESVPENHVASMQEELAAVKLRATHDHFGSDETDAGEGSEGITLRKRLRRSIDITRRGEWTGKWGKIYHDDNRAVFSNGDGIFTALSPKTKNLVVRPSLLQARAA